MKTTDKSARKPNVTSAPKPDPYYAKFAKLFREQGLEVSDNDYELIDLSIKACDRLLDLRSFGRQ